MRAHHGHASAVRLRRQQELEWRTTNSHDFDLRHGKGVVYKKKLFFLYTTPYHGSEPGNPQARVSVDDFVQRKDKFFFFFVVITVSVDGKEA